MTFQETLLRERKKRGLSQEELAERLGVSRQAVSKWETGEASPDLSKLLSLSEALGVSLDVLCGLRDPEADAPADDGGTAGRRLLCRRWVSALLALVLLTGGFALGRITALDRGEAPSSSDQVGLSEPLPENFSVSGLSFRLTDDGSGLFYAFTPSHLSPGYTYQITFSAPDTEPVVLDAEAAGGVCSGQAPLLGSVGYNVTITISTGQSTRAVMVASGLSFSDHRISWMPA